MQVGEKGDRQREGDRETEREGRIERESVRAPS